MIYSICEIDGILTNVLITLEKQYQEELQKQEEERARLETERLKEEQLEAVAQDTEAVEEGLEDAVGSRNTDADVEHEDVNNKGVVQDDQTQEDIEEQHKAATKLQAIQRGKQARKDFNEKQKQKEGKPKGPNRFHRHQNRRNLREKASRQDRKKHLLFQEDLKGRFDKF